MKFKYVVILTAVWYTTVMSYSSTTMFYLMSLEFDRNDSGSQHKYNRQVYFDGSFFVVAAVGAC